MASDRKMRLFCCAWSRQNWHLLSDARTQAAVEIGERFADGLGTDQDLQDGYNAALNALVDLDPLNLPPRGTEERRRCDSILAAAGDAWAATSPNAVETWHEKVESIRAWPRVVDDERRADADAAAYFDTVIANLKANSGRQAHLLREIFGSLPFRRIILDPSWLTSTVTQLAEAIYVNRACLLVLDP